jgi:hypothetical protein
MLNETGLSKKTLTWRDIELIDGEVISDQAMTILQPASLKNHWQIISASQEPRAPTRRISAMSLAARITGKATIGVSFKGGT